MSEKLKTQQEPLAMSMFLNKEDFEKAQEDANQFTDASGKRDWHRCSVPMLKFFQSRGFVVIDGKSFMTELEYDQYSGEYADEVWEYNHRNDTV